MRYCIGGYFQAPLHLSISLAIMKNTPPLSKSYKHMYWIAEHFQHSCKEAGKQLCFQNSTHRVSWGALNHWVWINITISVPCNSAGCRCNTSGCSREKSNSYYPCEKTDTKRERMYEAGNGYRTSVSSPTTILSN